MQVLRKTHQDNEDSYVEFEEAVWDREIKSKKRRHGELIVEINQILDEIRDIEIELKE